MSSFKIAVLPGDGIGQEIVAEAVKVLRKVAEHSSATFEFEEAPVGGTAYDLTGTPLPEATLKLAQSSDAVLLGAVGGVKWEALDYSVRPERALLGLRKELGLFANLRPAKVYPQLVDASPLRPEIVSGIDVLVVRELTGDIYFGQPRGVETLPDGRKRGFNTMVYTSDEVERIARVAFEAARKRSSKVCSVDKANVLECTEMWRGEVIRVHADYQDVALSHMYVDNAAMQLIRWPRQFDVIVTGNIFGDILSDEASMLTGSIGMLPSPSLGGKTGMYEPIHGSAPDIAGQNKANPIATVLSAAMMLKHSFDLTTESDWIERAVEKVLDQGIRTADIAAGGQAVGCDAMGDALCRAIDEVVG